MKTKSASLDSVHSSYVGSRIEVHDFEEAFSEADSLVESTRLTLNYHLNTRGFIHLQLGRYGEGLADCMEARQMNPDLDQDNLMLANLLCYYHESTILPAMEQLKQGLSPTAFSKIAMAYHNTGFYAHAASYFQLALSVAETAQLAQLYNSLSASYLGAGLFIEGFQASAKAVLLDAEIDKTNYLASLRQVEGMGQDPSVLMPDYPSVEGRLDPDDGINEALTHYFERKYSHALESFDRIISDARKQLESNADDEKGRLLPGYINHRAMCHLNLGNFDEAISDCLEARQLDPDLEHANLRLAQFFKAEYDSSLKPLFDELEKEISAEGYNNVGVFYFKHGFFAHAATYFQLAVSISEGLVQAESYNNLAGAYLDFGCIIEALRAASKAVALNPKINKSNYNQASMRLKPMGLDPEELVEDRFSASGNDR
ncbi:MAG: tetratricopeptide repeat protein [Hormoscilla sp. GUM202]|nr:tetratricopeptide repeat protein [Hormoscilla sp. GUM202]